jgi:hypothetical protein
MNTNTTITVPAEAALTLLDEVRNAPPALPTRAEMCFALAMHAADTATLHELLSVYSDHHRDFLEAFGNVDIERMFKALPAGYDQYKAKS